MDSFGERLQRWDREKEQYERITNNHIGELALIYLQDMMPKQIRPTFELEKHNILTVAQLRTFFNRIIDDHKNDTKHGGDGLHEVRKGEPEENTENAGEAEFTEQEYQEVFSFMRNQRNNGKGGGRGQGSNGGKTNRSPPSLPPLGGKSAAEQSKIDRKYGLCHHCHQPGHIKAKCPVLDKVMAARRAERGKEAEKEAEKAAAKPL